MVSTKSIGTDLNLAEVNDKKWILHCNLSDNIIVISTYCKQPHWKVFQYKFEEKKNNSKNNNC